MHLRAEGFEALAQFLDLAAGIAEFGLSLREFAADAREFLVAF